MHGDNGSDQAATLEPTGAHSLQRADRVRDVADRSVGADSLQYEFIDRHGLVPGLFCLDPAD